MNTLPRQVRIPIAVCLLIAISIVSVQIVAAAGGEQRRGGAEGPQAAAQKFKAIWEPVNVPEDLELVSVHFVSPDEGWVAGGRADAQGGVIYHTRNGGMTWELQLGDPQSDDARIGQLRFIDATHGFAVQATGTGNTDTLLSTADGQAWSPSGSVSQNRYDYVFTTPTTGFMADPNRQIVRTTDGGKAWNPVYTCQIKTEIGGLTRDAQCYIHSLHFPTPMIGYAMGGPLPESAGNVLARTEDGGATWNAWVVTPGESANEGSLWFTDATTGIFRTDDGNLFRTADGGKTWTRANGQAARGSRVSFADADTGWMLQYQRMTYTSNGGRGWLSRDIAFPAPVADAVLVARDRGYAVGAHGMVYRYRIVPADYKAKGMLDAPAIALK